MGPNTDPVMETVRVEIDETGPFLSSDSFILVEGAGGRGAKIQNFPESNFFCENNFRTKCAKLLLATNQESTYLPLTTLPKNAYSMFLCYNKIQYNTK